MGCFWGPDPLFRKIPGVVDVAVGYTGGTKEHPTYEEVCAGDTGHAEAVEITYDPQKVSYEKLLDVFWENHDPTTLNKQGPDIGTQYRSAIFYYSADQQMLAHKSKEEIEHSGRFDDSIVTKIAPAGEFWRAEEYHQQYFAKKGIVPRCHS